MLVGRCSPTGQDTPLRPWREALLVAARAGRTPGATLEPFVPALARVVPEWGAAADDPSPLVLGEAVLRLLSSWATPTATTLLVIEDLHWADPESLEVLEYVVDNVAGAPLLVVATRREGESGAGADLARDLVARRAALALPLDALTDAEVLAVAHSCLDGGDLPEEAAAVLVERSEGVPFLVEELLATAVRSGWDTIGDDIPGSITTSVATRVADLPPAARPLLTTAALLGRNFDWPLAASAVGLDDDEAAELLRQAVRAQLVDVEGAGFRFRHALTRDAVLAGALPTEQIGLAGRALEVLLAADPDLPGERCTLGAQLANAAGQSDLAATLWLRAAERALDGGSLASADSLATRARETGTGETRHAAGLLLLRACAQSGQTARAAALGTELLALGTDPEERADVHLVLGAADLAAGRWDDAEAHASDTRILAKGDPAHLARADALAAQAAMSRSEPDAALALARAALDGARATDQPAVECEALEVIGRAERGRDLDAAEAAFQQAHDIATAAGLRPPPCPRHAGARHDRHVRLPGRRADAVGAADGGGGRCAGDGGDRRPPARPRSTRPVARSRSPSRRRGAARRRRAAGDCPPCRWRSSCRGSCTPSWAIGPPPKPPSRRPSPPVLTAPTWRLERRGTSAASTTWWWETSRARSGASTPRWTSSASTRVPSTSSPGSGRCSARSSTTVATPPARRWRPSPSTRR